jgi:hypothetical protein
LLQQLHASKLSAVVTAFLCAFLLCATASAQDDDARMKELVQQGAGAFSEKRYADAAELFEQAYDAKPVPTLLKNSMVAWYKANDCAKAVHMGARFYRVATDAGKLEAQDQSEVQTVISCSLNLAQQRIDESNFAEAEDLLFTATSAGPTDEQTARIASLRDDLRAKRDATKENDSNADSSSAPQGSSGPSGLAITGWSITTIGALGLVGSVIYSQIAARDARDALDACEIGGNVSNSDYPCLSREFGREITQANVNEEIVDPVGRASQNEIIFYAVSGTVTAIGVGILVYHYLVDAPRESANLIVTPMLGEETAGAQLLWRF